VFAHPLDIVDNNGAFKEGIVEEIYEGGDIFCFPCNKAYKLMLNETQSAFSSIANRLHSSLPKGWNVIKPQLWKKFLVKDLANLPKQQGATMWPFVELLEKNPNEEQDAYWELVEVVAKGEDAETISWDGTSFNNNGKPEAVGQAILDAVRLAVGYNLPFVASCSRTNVLDVQLIPMKQEIPDAFWHGVAANARQWGLLQEKEEELFQLHGEQGEVQPLPRADLVGDTKRQVECGIAQKFGGVLNDIEVDQEKQGIPAEIAEVECRWRYKTKNWPEGDAWKFDHNLMLAQPKESASVETILDLMKQVEDGLAAYVIDANPVTDGDDGEENEHNWKLSVLMNDFFTKGMKDIDGLPMWEEPYVWDSAQNAQFYMGAEKSSTPMHRDKGSSVSYNVLLRGKKVWLFIEPGSSLRYIEAFKNSSGGAGAEIFMPSVEQLKYRNIKYYTMEQNRGDCIVVPPNVFHMVINVDKGVIVAYAWDIIPQDWAHASFRAQLMRSLLYEHLDEYLIHYKIVEIACAREEGTSPALLKVAVDLFKIHLGYVYLLRKLGWIVEDGGAYDPALDESIRPCSCCLQPCLWGDATPVASNPGYKMCLACFYKVYVGFGKLEGDFIANINKNLPQLLSMPKIVQYPDAIMNAICTAEEAKRARVIDQPGGNVEHEGEASINSEGAQKKAKFVGD
jgi:hypothetical protein